MVKLPIRNKSKDNPYTLDYNELTNTYIVEFKDNKNERHIVEISEKVYQAFDKFELEDISQMHEYERHIEHLNLDENSIYKRSNSISTTIEEEIINKSSFEELKKAIKQLPEVQQRRIKKYYFEEKNEYEIAKEEGATQQAINKSLIQARQKLKEILKK
ncbi:MAG: sigma-70 family RNA polymerase sigma factor [Clostridiales bacterium]|nr:sigma-70 family RNA polymerase sigma factor [Clostridiales bacterium]